MAELMKEVDISRGQAQAIARGLYAVAKADGYVHEREAMLIADFYVATTDSPLDFAALERETAITPEDLASHLPDKDLAEAFIKTAMLLAYADGNYGGQEAQAIATYSRALKTTEAELNTYEAQVKDFMLSQLNHIQNTDAVVDVAKTLNRT